MEGNMLIVHGGAPTAVINASLYGAIQEAKASGAIRTIYGARGGSAGLIAGDFINLSLLENTTLERLPATPASYIGTSRDHVRDQDYDRIIEVLVEQDIKALLFTGGNGSMDTCGKIARRIETRFPGKGIRVAGIPKTIDNDIAVTDHAPGFGSAARYLAASVRELAQDIASLPIHVCIVESMGRNAGWLTAAAALAKENPSYGDTCGSAVGPHLIYVPEIPFDEEEFLDSAKTLYSRYGGVLVVASEGLKNRAGKNIVPPIFEVGRSLYYGDVSAHLCNLVIQKLGIKARSEKPGVLGRCSATHQSPVDRDEAIQAGRKAVNAVLEGETGFMVGFKRISTDPYRCDTMLIPLEEVMLKESTLPLKYVSAEGSGIEQSYVDWCKPLIGRPLDTYPNVRG